MATETESTVDHARLIELFFDLTFVYAVSQMTSLLMQIGKDIHFNDFLQYLLTALTILQAWVYQANYTNRFHNGKWYDYLIKILNMMAILILSNVIDLSWRSSHQIFCLVMIVIVGGIGILYARQYRRDSYGIADAKQLIQIHVLMTSLYVMSFLVSYFVSVE